MNERKTIFVVDDDDDDRMLIREALVGIESTVDVVDVAHADAHKKTKGSRLPGG